MVNNIANIFIANASDGVKDLAIDVCIASGENDVFIDMDTVKDRLQEENTQEYRDLQEIIKEAENLDAEYIHLF